MVSSRLGLTAADQSHGIAAVARNSFLGENVLHWVIRGRVGIEALKWLKQADFAAKGEKNDRIGGVRR